MRTRALIAPLVATCLLTFLAPTVPAQASATSQITIVATTDLHGNAVNWDYFKNAPYSDKYGNHVGLAGVGTVVKNIRAEKGAENVIVVDNGDTIQGTPLAYHAAKVDPISVDGRVHPMASAMNVIGYDAHNVGNHEFNYGLDLLRTYEQQLDFPLLAANVVDVRSGGPVFKPYTMVTRRPAGANKIINVGILGLTTPGSMMWDKSHLAGKVRITDMESAARKWVPRMRANGADVVIVLAHGGIGPSSYSEDGLGPENPCDQLAAKVAGIDAIIMGHTHQSVANKVVTNAATGKNVVLTQPRNWGQQVSEITVDLSFNAGAWTVATTSARLHDNGKVEPDPGVLKAVEQAHAATVDYVNTPIATSPRELSAAESRYRDTAIIDLIQHVQTETVTKALKNGPYQGLPVLSLAAPFSRTAILPAGQVSVRDIAALYVYDNTLQAKVLTGAQIKDYLEFSAKYFVTKPAGSTFDPDNDTNATINGLKVWDYNFDVIAGLDYAIDISQPVGQRITSLTNPDGTPVDSQQRYVVAVNNYRAQGGGNFPHLAQAPVAYDSGAEIRQLMIDWAKVAQVIDSDVFFRSNWRVVIQDKPI